MGSPCLCGRIDSFSALFTGIIVDTTKLMDRYTPTPPISSELAFALTELRSQMSDPLSSSLSTDVDSTVRPWLY
jgi:hypothetical protein